MRLPSGEREISHPGKGDRGLGVKARDGKCSEGRSDGQSAIWRHSG